MIFAFSYYILSFLVGMISPFWGLVGFICSLLLRFQDHYPEIVVIKPFTFLLFGMLLSCIINKHKLSPRSWKQDKAIAYLLLLSILGLLVMGRGALIHETYLFLCSIGIYYVTSRILQTPGQFITLFFCMALSVAYLAYLAIVDVNLYSLSSVYIDPRSDRWQGLGYYENSNEFGQLMITTIPFLLASILIRKSKILSLASIALMSIMIYVMVKCESRTVMITLGLMFVGTFMFRGSGNLFKKLSIGLTLSIIILGVLSITPGPIQDRLGTVLDAGNDESFQGRTRSWDYGFAMLSWYPITGVGKGQWIEYHGLMPHNSYVQVMAEMGIFGIWVFLWLIRLSFLEFKAIFKHTTPLSNAPPKDDEFNTHSSLFDETNIDNEKPSFYHLPDEVTAEVTIPESHTGLTNMEKSVAIAVLVTFSGWLLYIFLGNQAYSIWTYFYFGTCAALANFLPESDKTVEASIFNEPA
jgi:hypothetical protein